MNPTSTAAGSAASHGDRVRFETVAEETFRRYGRNWKPATHPPSPTDQPRQPRRIQQAMQRARPALPQIVTHMSI